MVRVFLLLCCLLLVVGCTVSMPESPAAPTAGGEATPGGATLNITVLGRLDRTEQIEIERLVEGEEMAYETVATITDPSTIEEFVQILNTDLAELPRVSCLDQYKLSFVQDDGTTYNFGLACTGDEQFLHGDPPFLQEHDVRAPDALQDLIQRVAEEE